MKKLACLTIALVFSLSVANADEQIMYTNDTFARLSYINGNVYIQRAAELDYEEGMVNMPVTEGDRMGTTEGRAEIQLSRGKYLRLDQHTKMDFLNLPNQVNDLTRIKIWRGNIFFSIMSLKKEKTIEIHTDDTSLYVLEAGLYRIDVRGEETEILVFRGLLEAAGENGSVLLRDAQRIEVVNGHFLGRPSNFMAVAEDSFDRWSEGRDLELRKRMARRYLPAELEDFEYELAYYGNWTYIFPYGYVWVPGGIAVDWRPYWHGRWIWLPVCGWTWLPYEPWGWATFHYGRWHWSVSFGWYWIPTTVWGPGWVHWYSRYDYIGWAPVDYWGSSTVVKNSRVLTVIRKDQLRARDISRVALSQNSVKNIGQMTRAKTQPAIKQISRSKISIKSPFTPATKMSESENTKRVKITSSEIKREKEVRNIPKTTTKTKPKKTSTTLGKITSVLSSKSKKSSSSKSTSSKSSSTKKIKSSSISKPKTSSKVKKTSPPKSSSRERVSSKKVKKKK